MALIPVDIGGAIELQNAVPGRYDLTIAACEKTFSKEKQKPQFKISVGVDGQDNVGNISHYLSIPSEKDDADQLKFKALLMKRWCMLFGIPITPNMDDEQLSLSMVGARAKSVEVTVSEPDPTSGATYNRIMVPKLKGEGAPKAPGQVARPPKS